ncbi:hypothetical protein DFH09DRAFT_1311759 [Mycena vulgaris]|nr:hypothetical protein DFH09DRAFT_1311759 [Mycena vulgaris]
MEVVLPTDRSSATLLESALASSLVYEAIWVGLLFATGELEPLLVNVGQRRAATGPTITSLDYLPWLTGSAAVPPADHSYLELAVMESDGQLEYFTVVVVDQDHHARAVHPENACVNDMLGSGGNWTGNVLVIRRSGGRFAHIDQACMPLAKEAVMRVVSIGRVEIDDVHTDSE